jgi:hypothetical protein
MKYAGNIRRQTNEKYWQFKITDTDKSRIDELRRTGLKTFLMLICGDAQMKEGDIAILTADEFEQASLKTGIRVKLIGKSPKVFTIADMDSRKVWTVPRNRIERRLTDIE